MKLKANKRTILKKKVKSLRKAKEIPAAAYGPEFKSINLKVDLVEFSKLFRKAGYARLIDLEIENKKPQKTLIKEVQINPITNEYIHVSFYVVDMKKEIEAEVPIELKGISPAEKNNIGFLETPYTTVRIKCLPSDLPSEIKINIETLAEIGDSIQIKDLKLDKKLELAGDFDKSTTIAFIAAPQKIEIEEEEKEEETTDEETEEGESEGEPIEAKEGEKTSEKEMKQNEPDKNASNKPSDK